jgi:hypothetical protein
MTEYYEIRIKGHLDPSWADWLGGLTITHEANGESLLAGPLPDQAALHGALNRLHDLGIRLISVNLAEGTSSPDEADAAEGT